MDYDFEFHRLTSSSSSFSSSESPSSPHQHHGPSPLFVQLLHDDHHILHDHDDDDDQAASTLSVSLNHHQNDHAINTPNSTSIYQGHLLPLGHHHSNLFYNHINLINYNNHLENPNNRTIASSFSTDLSYHRRRDLSGVHDSPIIISVRECGSGSTVQHLKDDSVCFNLHRSSAGLTDRLISGHINSCTTSTDNIRMPANSLYHNGIVHGYNDNKNKRNERHLDINSTVNGISDIRPSSVAQSTSPSSSSSSSSSEPVSPSLSSSSMTDLTASTSCSWIVAMESNYRCYTRLLKSLIIVNSNDGYNGGDNDDTNKITNHEDAPKQYIPQCNGSKFPYNGAVSSERQEHGEGRALLTKLHTMKKRIKLIFSHCKGKENEIEKKRKQKDETLRHSDVIAGNELIQELDRTSDTPSPSSNNVRFWTKKKEQLMNSVQNVCHEAMVSDRFDLAGFYSKNKIKSNEKVQKKNRRENRGYKKSDSKTGDSGRCNPSKQVMVAEMEGGEGHEDDEYMMSAVQEAIAHCKQQ